MPITELTYQSTIANYTGTNLIADLPDQLIDLWYAESVRLYPQAQMLTVTLPDNGSSFTYLFEQTRQRTIAAVGIPTFIAHKRDAGRMAGHPQSQGATYHRGHLMAHSIGGGADINLVPQLGSLNIGQFRVMERIVRRLAKESTRCLYFVRTIYPPDTATQTNLTQLPAQIEQAIVFQSGVLQYALHANA